MDFERIEAAIREFVLERFPVARHRCVSGDDSLIEKGVVDSLGILEVVGFMEKEFQITVSDEDLQPENFDSIHAMSRYIYQQQGCRGAQ